ncbi:similar to DKFZP566K1924 protein, isoform CRA_c [Rattus norvegicus]|uniref:Similar to DKFZP566K1924 protein, isoform CRA_c n=1 Tax=Rattus norvegicus TaxID=10116 RepID=A6JPY7_RAT|nr:similar to DKFZP566K1924 protein, isoform CRA_c [Rattus norvegicus]
MMALFSSRWTGSALGRTVQSSCSPVPPTRWRGSPNQKWRATTHPDHHAVHRHWDLRDGVASQVLQLPQARPLPVGKPVLRH